MSQPVLTCMHRCGLFKTIKKVPLLKMRKSFLMLIIVLVLSHCKNISEEPKFFQVNLDDCDQIGLKLSDLIDSCRLVQLETTNEYILDNIDFIYVTEDLILICDRNGVYKFSGDGRFLKKIIRTGRGPDEISGYCIYHYYEAKNTLLIANRMASDDHILLYDIKSECFLTPVKKCFPIAWSDFIVYEDSLILGSIEIAGYLPQDPDPNPYALFIQNLRGEFISGIKSTKRLVHEDYKGLFQRMSIHPGDEYIHVKNSHDDTIFNFRNNTISPYLIPVYKSSSDIPKLLPDIGTKHLRLGEYENRSFLMFNISEFTGWKNENGFGSAVYNYNFYFLDKSSGKYAQIESFNDDLIGKETEIETSMRQIPGAPISLPNGKLYLLYFPHQLIKSTNQNNSPFPKTLLSEMELIRGKINETDNPVLLIGVPKIKLQILE